MLRSVVLTRADLELTSSAVRLAARVHSGRAHGVCTPDERAARVRLAALLDVLGVQFGAAQSAALLIDCPAPAPAVRDAV